MFPDAGRCDAWHPGVRPGIPPEFRNLESIVRPECVFGNVDEIAEIANLTGLPLEEVTPFRPWRLALHELIVRVTADIVGLEGYDQEALGLYFRQTTKTIWDNYIDSQMDVLEGIYAEFRAKVEAAIRKILAESLFRKSTESTPRYIPLGIYKWISRRRIGAAEWATEDIEQQLVAGYKAAGLSQEDPLLRAIYQSLYRVLSTMLGTRGYIAADQRLLVIIITDHVCNRYGSQTIGMEIARSVEAAICNEGYSRVHVQNAPVMVSLKGASAAGKSSLRPMLQRFISDQGIASEGYVTISPDIWRRLLLDYDGLGPATKYAGYLTSREVEVIDGKLDRYIQEKADLQRAIPHLMVDRFRFDSFSGQHVKRILDATYAKYVDTMYMYFIVTPPEETVERGWTRALERGRYKAVEDFLGHCVEAYRGMPLILFKWLAHQHPHYRYYFLDNMVTKGTFPKVCAHGDRITLRIHDPRIFINVERYKKINIYAQCPAQLYPEQAEMAVVNNLRFLRECIRRIPEVCFIGHSDEVPCLQISHGKLAWVDAAAIGGYAADGEVSEIMSLLLTTLGKSTDCGPLISAGPAG